MNQGTGKSSTFTSSTWESTQQKHSLLVARLHSSDDQVCITKYTILRYFTLLQLYHTRYEASYYFLQWMVFLLNSNAQQQRSSYPNNVHRGWKNWAGRGFRRISRVGGGSTASVVASFRCVFIHNLYSHSPRGVEPISSLPPSLSPSTEDMHAQHTPPASSSIGKRVITLGLCTQSFTHEQPSTHARVTFRPPSRARKSFPARRKGTTTLTTAHSRLLRRVTFYFATVKKE